MHLVIVHGLGLLLLFDYYLRDRLLWLCKFDLRIVCFTCRFDGLCGLDDLQCFVCVGCVPFEVVLVALYLWFAYLVLGILLYIRCYCGTVFGLALRVCRLFCLCLFLTFGELLLCVGF